MKRTHKMNIAGVECDLPLCEVNEHLDIAAFILFGNVEVTIAAARELVEKCPDFDVVVTPEAKSIPLAYEISRQTGKPYIVARKGTKVYMTDPIKVSVVSITTQRPQELYLGREEVELMRGKKVLLVDDVISTGESIAALRELVKEAEGEEVAAAAVLAEGDAADRKDIVFLEKLPVFPK